MQRRFIVLAMLVLAAAPRPARAETSVQFGVGTPSLQFDFLYRKDGLDPVRVQRHVADIGEADYLVALHLARCSSTDLEIILQWRRDGARWDAITHRCHLDSQIYYVELPPDVPLRPPYGRACGFWRKNRRGNLVLGDDEIRELVLVKSLARHGGLPAGEVVRRRGAGHSPKDIAGARGHGGPREDTAPRSAPSKGRGKGGKHPGR